MSPSIKGALIIMMAVSWTAFIWSAATHNTRYDEEAAAYASRYESSILSNVEDSCEGLVGADLTNCVSRFLAAQRDSYRSELNLAAQRKMADWALGVLGVSALTLAVTAVGVLLVYFTLAEARKTTQAAVRAADEASKTNEITKRAFISDQRPWIDVDVEIESDIKLTDEGMSFLCRVKIRNTGKSPATSVFVVPIVDFAEPEKFKDLTTKMMAHWVSNYNLRMLDKINWGSRLGDAVFPGEGRGRTYPMEAKKDRLERGKQGAEVMPGILIACTYGPKEDGSFYVTAKVFHINGPGNSKKVNPISIPADGVIKKSDVRISHVFSASHVT